MDHIGAAQGPGQHQIANQQGNIRRGLQQLQRLFTAGGFQRQPAQLMQLFTSNPDTIAAGAKALRIICIGFVVSAVSTTSSGALEGLGKGVPSLVISLCRYVVFILPLAAVLCCRLGPDGVWHAFWITEVLTALVAYPVYRRAATRP